MNLFRQTITNPDNFLPKDGCVKYFGAIISLSESDQFLNTLLKSIQWENDQALIYGKHFVTKRKVAWYADQPFQYTYSNITKRALPWNDLLLTLKLLVEETTGQHFNACLLNLYHDGDEGMAWHSDNEKALQKNGAIASLSFGAERTFSFKHKKTKQVLSLLLEHGSLLVMQGATQTHWQHRLPPSKKITEARVNLTFRNMSKN